MMLKRAWIYLRRKNKRSIILLLLLFIISCSISIGLSVWNNIGDAIKEIEQRMGTSFVVKLPTFSYYPNADYWVHLDTKYDFISAACYNGPLLDDTVIEAILGLEGINAYNADCYAPAYLDDAKVYPGAWTERLSQTGYDSDARLIQTLWSQSVELYGNTDTSLVEKFVSGSFTLIEGRHITADDSYKIIVSKEFAEINNLKIGDTITISHRLGMRIETPDRLALTAEPMTLEIVGIFHVNDYQPVGEWVYEDQIAYNWIFVDNTTVKEFNRRSNEGIFAEQRPYAYYDNLTFFVDDPARLESIVEEVKALNIENGFFDIKIDDTMYKSTTDALRNIRNIVLALVAVIVTGCAVVLLIVFTMWVQSRKQEIAIYLSLGLSKASIFGQFVLEAAIVAVLAGALAFGVCQEVPNMVGNYMLADAIEDAQPDWEEPTREEIHQAAQAGTMSELFQYTNSEYAGPEQIDFAFHFTDFLVLLLLELLLIIAAILKGGWFIFNIQPRKIMTDLR